MSQLKKNFKWHYLGIILILILSLFLNLYKLGQEGLGNLYYSAAVKSMQMSWHNFFFNSFDPKGFITIDKPPIGFWIQTLSVDLFGFNGWSLFFPQALAGVLSVVILYNIIARVYGIGAGLLSALFFALTPIVVATDRTNEVDSMLMLVSLMATWAISKTTETKPLKWLLFAFILVGLGFNIKMMEAFLILPSFYLFYLLATKLTVRRKVVHLFMATLVLVVVSLSWSLIVDSVPSNQRPYIGSTQHNSMVELAIGYNGINRLIGQQHDFHDSPLWSQQKHYGSNEQTNSENNYYKRSATSNSGLFRLFVTPQLVGQLSWLLPACLISIVFLLREIRFRVKMNRKQHLLIFWTVWVLTMFIFFSHIANMMNSYYMVMLAPGIAALAGVGLKQMWDHWHSKNTKGAWFLPITFLSNVLFEIVVVWRYPSLRVSLSLILSIFSSIALICLILIKYLNEINNRRFAILSALTGVLALVMVPTIWSYSPIQYGGSVTKPFAGIELKSERAWDAEKINRKLENFLKTNYKSGTFLLATVDATTAAPILLDTNLPVMAIGGFKGTDPALTVNQLQKMTNKGQVQYFLLRGTSNGYENKAVIDWIQSNCRMVPRNDWQEKYTQFGKYNNNTGTILYQYVKVNHL